MNKLITSSQKLFTVSLGLLRSLQTNLACEVDDPQKGLSEAIVRNLWQV